MRQPKFVTLSQVVDLAAHIGVLTFGEPVERRLISPAGGLLIELHE